MMAHVEQHNEHCRLTWDGERWWIDEIYAEELVFLGNEVRFACVPLAWIIARHFGVADCFPSPRELSATEIHRAGADLGLWEVTR